MEDNRTIGQIIGTVSHNLSITNAKDEKVQLTIKIDFSNASDTDLKAWLCSNRAIAGQRPWRALSKDELVKLNGMTFMAETIGQKVKSLKETTAALLSQFSGKSREEIIESFMNAGVPKEKAELMADAMLAK